MRKITSFLFSVLMLLGMTAKAETILFQTDFGSEDWVGHEPFAKARQPKRQSTESISVATTLENSTQLTMEC